MLPPLYKFRLIDAKNFENDFTLDSLRYAYVHFSNMAALNDPFEMGVFLDQAPDVEAARIEFMATDWSGSPMGKALETMDRKSRNKFLSARWNCDEWREGFLNSWRAEDGFRDELKKRMTIYCASATRTDGLLWAHYSWGHRGIAIELNANADKNLRNARKVHYEKAFPVIDVLQDDDDTKFRKGMLTKSEDWKYEKEYRAIYPTQSESVKHKVCPSTFVSITFGAKISEEIRDEVIKATRPRLSHVRFEQARLGKLSYSMKFEEYQVKP